MNTASDESSSGGLPALTPLAAAVLHVSPDPERVLQVGCGTGDGVLFLAREFPRARVRGIDRSPEAIRAAVAKVGLDPEGRVAFKHSPGRRLPYPDAHFDVIVQTGGPLALGEVRRVLRRNGHLVLVRNAPASSTKRRRLGASIHRLVERLLGNAKRTSARTGTRWPSRRLKRHGLQVVKTGEAGDGTFCVTSLAGADSQTPPE
jgi:ubiquinone/menaquinone biosynthesis C-methylase UbiE